ncbi:YcxB family protein [Rhizobium leguminosarum]|uniref:YcxB family protein n=1 Tax=Rhizobium leguminosarum TaxID=384 RepID=UPI001C961661|nr:YcxB family protein [Rhizobium leguminosarum]MBY5444564.1 YcxB family protein [Rhizobium leguminosarum]
MTLLSLSSGGEAPDQKGLWAAEALSVAFFIWLLWRGEPGWLSSPLSAFFPLLDYRDVAAHHRNTVGKFRRMLSRSADFTFLDEGLEVVSDLGSAKIPWSAITEIWERSSYWMIFTAPSQFMHCRLKACQRRIETLYDSIMQPELPRKS